MPKRKHPFHEKPAAQNSSPLTRLPAELRLMVLRHAMTDHEPLRSKKEMLGHYKLQVQLSSQILRVCQQLYFEGKEVLYGENTLFLHYQLSTFARHSTFVQIDKAVVNVLDLSIDVPWSPDKLSGPATRLATQFIPYVKKLSKNACLERVQQFREMYKVIATFQRFEVKIDHLCQKELYVACRILRDLLLNKDVTISVQHPDDSMLHRNSKLEDPLRHNFSFLRCRSIHFANLTGTSAVESQITSDTPCDDTFLLHTKFMKAVITPLEETSGGRGFQSKECELFWKYRQASMTYDLARLQKLERKILRRAVKWNKTWAENKRQDLLLEIQNALSEVEKSKEDEAKATIKLASAMNELRAGSGQASEDQDAGAQVEKGVEVNSAGGKKRGKGRKSRAARASAKV